jgi:hypothetical protein
MALICRTCKATLPDEAQFCMGCAAPTKDAYRVGGSLAPRGAGSLPPIDQSDEETANYPSFPRTRDSSRRARVGGTGFRIAAMILSLALTVVVGLQSCLGTVAGGLARNEGLTQGSSVGFLVACLFLLGGALALPTPTFSLVVFLIAGVLGVLGGATTPYGDLTIWGIAGFGIAALCYLGRGRSRGGDASFAISRRCHSRP